MVVQPLIHSSNVALLPLASAAVNFLQNIWEKLLHHLVKIMFLLLLLMMMMDLNLFQMGPSITMVLFPMLMMVVVDVNSQLSSAKSIIDCKGKEGKVNKI